jgi:dGTPase
LAHDIGNPPFGHSGEDVIGSWFEGYFNGHGVLSDVPDGVKKELLKFEGNAQGFRILTHLEIYKKDGGMRLSMPVLAAFQKYPARKRTSEFLGKEYYIGLKKFGVFESEWPSFASIAQKLGMIEEASDHGSWFRRHPLVYLVEAADDICYEIVDLEDALTSGDLDEITVLDALKPISNSNSDVSDKSTSEQIAYLRAVAIGKAIDSCVDAFKENYEEIMQGQFNYSLVKSSSLAGDFSKISGLASKRIFTARRKTELEVSGRSVLRRVLNNLIPVYEELSKCQWDSSQLSSHNEQILRALDLNLSEVKTNEQALQSMADFVAGMTGRYVVKVSKQLSGIQ